LPEEQKIGLGSFAAPQTIQSVLFGFPPIKRMGKEVNVLAGNLKQFAIHNCFDQRNVKIFMDLLKKDSADYGKPNFMGPESFCDVDDEAFKPTIPYGLNGKLYEKMMSHPKVQEILEKLEGDNNIENKWINIDSRHAKFIIVFSN